MENVLTNDAVLALGVSQTQYDSVSLNRKSTFVNLFDENGDFVVSANTLDMKGGQDALFLAEVLRAAELGGLVPLNSLVSYKGLKFRLAAIQTSALNTGLKINAAKKEDFKKSSAPTAPAAAQATQPIQQVF